MSDKMSFCCNTGEKVLTAPVQELSSPRSGVTLWATLTLIVSAPLYLCRDVKEQENGQEDQTGPFDGNFQKHIVWKDSTGLVRA